MSTYYIKNGGNDGLDGLSDANAWATKARTNTALSSANPDDSFLFNRGDVWTDDALVCNRSGSIGHPITIGAYGTGANPLFRAKTVAELGKTWTLETIAGSAVLISDNFNDNSFDFSKWSYTGLGSVLETNQEIEQSNAGAYQGNSFYSIATFALTGSAASINIVDKQHPYWAFFLQDAQTSATNGLGWNIDGGTTLRAQKLVTSATTDVATVTFNAVTHKYLRIMEASGTIYWDYSSDGTNWNNLGSTATPITITALYYTVTVNQGPGGNVTSKFDDVNWASTATSFTVYYIGTQTYDPVYAVDSDGTLLLEKGSKATMTLGSSYYDSGASRLYVRTATDIAPTTGVFIPNNVSAAAFDLAVDTANIAYININNIDIKYARFDGFRISSDFTNTSDCNVDFAGGAGFYHFHNWTGAGKGADNCNTYRCVASHCCILNSQAFTSEGANNWWYSCIAHDNQMAGFDFLDYSANTASAGSGAKNCISHTNAQRSGSYDPNFYCDGAHDITLDGCLSYDPGGTNPHAIVGFAFSSETVGKVPYNITMKNCISIANKGYCLTISSNGTDKATNIQVYNNTFIDSASSYEMLDFEQLGTDGIIFKNNICYASHGTKMGYWDTVDRPYIHSDYNDFYSTNANIINISGTDYTLATWRTLSGGDANSISGDPLLDISYNLLPGSPCINTGLTQASVTTDYKGQGRPQGSAYCMGAFEYTDKDYTKQDIVALPSDDTDLTTAFGSSDYSAVSSVDGISTDQISETGRYSNFLFKDKYASKVPVVITWTGQSNRAPSSSIVYLQIYNRTSMTWEVVASNNTAGVNTNFTLTGSPNSSLSNYYDISNYISCRVYQQAA
jgi:hypothetical protein